MIADEATLSCSGRSAPGEPCRLTGGTHASTVAAIAVHDEYLVYGRLGELPERKLSRVRRPHRLTARQQAVDVAAVLTHEVDPLIALKRDLAAVRRPGREAVSPASCESVSPAAIDIHDEDPSGPDEDNLLLVRRPAQARTAGARNPAESAPVNSNGREPAVALERDPSAVRRPCELIRRTGLFDTSPQSSVVAHDVHNRIAKPAEEGNLPAVGRPGWIGFVAVRTVAQISPRASSRIDDENLPVVADLYVLRPEPIRVGDPPAPAGSGDRPSRRSNAQRANDDHQGVELHSSSVTLPGPNVQAQTA